MRHEFSVSRLLSGSIPVIGVLWITAGMVGIAGTPTPWRLVLGILFVIGGATDLHTWRWVTRSPMIAITEEALEARAPFTRRPARIERGKVTGTAWMGSADLGLRLRSGGTARIPLAGQARRDKPAVCDLLAAWPTKA